MKKVAIITGALFLLITSLAHAGQVVTVTEKDGKITKQVVTTTTKTVAKEMSQEDATTELEQAQSTLANLNKLNKIVISDADALALFYYMEKLPYSEKATLKATLTEDISEEDDFVKKMDAVLKDK